MKIYNSDDLKIDIDNVRKTLTLSLIKYNEITKKEYIDRFVSLKEEINLKIEDVVYTNIKLIDVESDNKKYVYDDTFDYITYIKSETNIKNVLFLYEEKEPWFEIDVSSMKISLTFDPLFSKINSADKYDNMIYLPRDKNIFKRFLYKAGIVKNNDLNKNKLYYGILLKDIKYLYEGVNGLNSVVSIVYDDFYILSESNVRALKLSNIIL